MISHCLPLACEVVPSSGVLKGFGRRLHQSLTIQIGKKGGLKAHRKHLVDKRRRRKAGGGGRREKKEGGGWREEGGERRKEEGVFQTVQSAYYLFSRSLLAASTIVLEALGGQDCVLERLRRPQIDKISVLEGSRRR